MRKRGEEGVNTKMEIDLPHKELTKEVIAAAISVHQELRPGLDEKLYERALCIELAERGVGFEQQPKYEAFYKKRFIGHLVPDLVIENKLIVDAKCVESFTSLHEAQIIGYLNISKLEIGLLLNFKTWPLGKRRLFRSQS